MGEGVGGVGKVCSGGPQSRPPNEGLRLSSAIGWQHRPELEAFRAGGAAVRKAEGRYGGAAGGVAAALRRRERWGSGRRWDADL